MINTFPDGDSQTDSTGSFRFRNVPPNSYHLTVVAPGFNTADRDFRCAPLCPSRSAFRSPLAGEHSSVTVEAGAPTCWRMSPMRTMMSTAL
jgi:hypothetical protein